MTELEKELLATLQSLCKAVAPHVHKLNVKTGFSEKVQLAQAEKLIHRLTEKP